MGRNGAGKTTMLKSLVRNAPGFIEDKDQQFPIDGGEVRWGHEVAVGYFAQDHGESITKGMTAIDWLDRSPEEKWQIVQEGMKSGNVSETCRGFGIAQTLYYCWKHEAQSRERRQRLGGEAPPRRKP